MPKNGFMADLVVQSAKEQAALADPPAEAPPNGKPAEATPAAAKPRPERKPKPAAAQPETAPDPQRDRVASILSRRQSPTEVVRRWFSFRLPDDLHRQIKTVIAEYGLTTQEFGETAVMLLLERLREEPVAPRETA